MTFSGLGLRRTRVIVPAVALACLTACADGPGSPNSSSGGSVAVTPTRACSDTGTAGPTNAGAGFDSSHALTEEEALAISRQELARFAQQLNLTNPPQVQLVRFISPAEMGKSRVPCLVEMGFPATETENGFKMGDIPEGQGPAANEAQYICEAKYPVHPQYTLPRSDTARGKEYDWMAQELIPCYRQQGYTISEPPSKESWIASFDSGEVWMPEDDVLKVISPKSAEWTALSRACPPPSFEEFLEHPPTITR